MESQLLFIQWMGKKRKRPLRMPIEPQFLVSLWKGVLEDKSGDPEEALADLAVMELMLTSGEEGQSIAFKY